MEENEELVSTSKNKTAYLSMIGHEVKTPLNAILGCSELLQKEFGTHEYFDVIKSSSNTILETMNSILKYAKLEGKKQDLLEKANFELCGFVKDIVRIVNIEAQRKQLELDNQWCIESEVRHVFGDAVRLREILLNLLSNAIKFTNKGSITVKVEEVQEFRFQFTVKDTGIGMSEEFKANVFSPFSQQLRNDAKGSGLGLSISRTLARLMQGEIEFDSQHGVGTTFVCTVQLEPTTVLTVSTPSADQQQEQTTRLPCSSLRVLVVDDALVNAKVLAKFVEQCGVKLVEYVNSVESAQAKLSQDSYDVIFTDLHLPGMTGVELCDWIRSSYKYKQPHVVLVTGDEEFVRNAKTKQNFDDTLAKPVLQAHVSVALQKFAATDK